MIKLPYETCFGCGGCDNVCPVRAIAMVPDKYGFVHPEIDTEKCIECHLCEKVCTVYHPQKLEEPRDVIAAVTNNYIELQSVASGGLCTQLGVEIIKRGGVVYGCSEKNYLNIQHIRVEKIEDLDLLKKSKYVHSSMGTVMKQVKKDLDNGQEVLFIGTPCQVSGLYGFLHKQYDNLYTVDVICHGVPSQQMLQSQMEAFGISKAVFVDFRWKSHNGIRYGIRCRVNGKTIKEQSEWQSAYMAAFSCGISYRENCYSCPFARSARVADITAADFWGIGRVTPSKFTDTNGVSMVLVNTIKGKTLFEGVASNFEIENHTIQEASRCNTNLSHPAPIPEHRARFLEIFANNGIARASYECIPKHRKFQNPLYRFFIGLPIIVKLYSIAKSILNNK